MVIPLIPETTKVITVWQPWAQLLARRAKRFETRGWWTSYRGPIALHAAKRWFSNDAYLLWDDVHIRAELPPAEWLDHYKWKGPLGAILAFANMVGCQRVETMEDKIDERERSFGDWRPGRWAWAFADMVVLDEPIPYVGEQGLVTIKPEGRELLAAQLERIRGRAG